MRVVDDQYTLWQVVSTRGRERQRMERCIEECGYRVAREGLLPREVRLSTVRAVAELTEVQHQVLEAMLEYDTAEEIANCLHLSRNTVYDQTKALMQLFGVRSRARVIVQALRSGVLELVSTRAGGSAPEKSGSEESPILGVEGSHDESTDDPSDQ